MKHTTKPLILLFIGISTGVFAQDTIHKKDTTRVGKIILAVIKDTVPRKETKKDIIIEKKLNKHFYGVPQFAHETYLFIATPTRWHEADWLRVGATIAITAAIMPIDQTLNKATQGNQHYYYSVPVVGGRIYGEWYTIGTVTAIFGGFGILAHDTTAKKIAIELFQAGAYSELFTEILKIGIGRSRPYQNEGAFKFRPFNLNNNTESMPSGHTTSAFALSTVMFRHAHSTFLKILAFVPAGFTVFSRLYQDFHWSSDCFLGAVSGFSTGMWVVTLHEKEDTKSMSPSIFNKVELKRGLKRRLFKGVFIVLIIPTLVILFISPLTKYVVEKYSIKYTGRQIKMEWAYVNPFTGYAHFSKLKIYEAASDSIFFTAEDISADFVLYKILSKTYEITSIVVDKPKGVLILNKRNDFNFNDLIIRFAALPADSAKPPLHFNILNLKINDGVFYFHSILSKINYFIKNVNFESSGKR